MDVKIILFGQLSEIAGSEYLVLKNVADTNGLREQLKLQYPAVAASKYMIVLNKKQVQENMPLLENQSIALLPPFSGG